MASAIARAVEALESELETLSKRREDIQTIVDQLLAMDRDVTQKKLKSEVKARKVYEADGVPIRRVASEKSRKGAWTPELNNKLVELCAEGLDNTAIGKKIGKSAGAVSVQLSVLRKRGVAIVRTKVEAV
jgi:hypothetical protein